MLQEPVVTVGHHLDMLRGDLVGHLQHFLIAVAEDDLAVVAPGDRCGIGRRQDLQQAVDLDHGLLRKTAGVGDQDCRRVVAVLRLPEQVGRADLRIDRLVGNHHGLGRSGEEIDADPAEELALGLCDIGVARPDQHVHGLDRLGAQRHGADGLDAAERIDLVRAAEMHGRHHRRVRLTLEGRRCRHDARHAGDGRGQHRHMRRGHHGELASRHVATNRLHRDVLMAQHDTRHGLDLDVLHGGALRLGEGAHLFLREGDVLHIARGDTVDEGVDLGGGEAEGRRAVVVELLAQRAHRRVAARLDIGEGAFDHRAHLGIVGGAIRFLLTPLQVFDHPILVCCALIGYRRTPDVGSACGCRIRTVDGRFDEADRATALDRVHQLAVGAAHPVRLYAEQLHDLQRGVLGRGAALTRAEFLPGETSRPRSMRFKLSTVAPVSTTEA